MRRRFMRRPGRLIGRMLMASIPPLLIRSNELLAVGKFPEAADGLEQLARAAEARGGRRAPRLYVEAGRARILAGQGKQGVELVKAGLGLLPATGLTLRFARSARRLVAELQKQGFSKEAQEISSYLMNLAPELVNAADEAVPARRPPLPTHCPGCGAPIRPDEVEWLDGITAECEYCGSPVRGE